MLIKDYKIEEKPREKFKNFGPNSLTEVELLAIILNTGTKEKSVIDLSREALNLIDDNLEVTLEELLTIKGIGEVKAIKILSILELAKRITSVKKANIRMTRSLEVYEYLRNNYLSATENFIVLFFNRGGKFIKERVYSNMSFSSVEVETNEIVKWALKYSASNVILAHNHPSGVTYPSESDLRVTKLVAKTLAKFEICLLDHLIFTENDYESLRKISPDIFI